MHVDKSNDIVNKYNNTYNASTKMKHTDVKSSTYIDFVVGNTNKDPKFNVSEHVRIKKFFQKATL